MGGVRWERCWKALGGCRCHLSHNLGDLFDQKYGYEQLPLHSLPQREPLTGHIPQEVLARPTRPGARAILLLHSMLISWQSPSLVLTVFETSNCEVLTTSLQQVNFYCKKYHYFET